MKRLLELAENNNIDGFKKEFNGIVSEILKNRLNQRAKTMSEESDVPDPAAVAGTLEDPVIDPNFDKEVFYKRYSVGKREVIIKRVGSGPNSPAISYIDGIRYEVFVTPQKAEKETQRAIQDGSFDKMQKEKEKRAKEIAALQTKNDKESASTPKEEEIKETTLDFLASIVKDREEKCLVFESGEQKNISINEAVQVLEMLKDLNNVNKSRFVYHMQSGLKQYEEMMNFLLDRIRKGVI